MTFKEKILNSHNRYRKDLELHFGPDIITVE